LIVVDGRNFSLDFVHGNFHRVYDTDIDRVVDILLRISSDYKEKKEDLPPC